MGVGEPGSIGCRCCASRGAQGSQRAAPSPQSTGRWTPTHGVLDARLAIRASRERARPARRESGEWA
eukprot:scaffold11869_cov30-Tisochrysis_lutea.AAC.6